MRDSDDSSEAEPLVPVEQIRGQKNSKNKDESPAFNVIPHHISKDLKSLEIVAVFVVAFDTHQGNVIEWAKPDFMKDQLNGIEFKAIPSGAHTLEEDMVYLYDADLYGVACYAKMSVDNREERGARMRSVGVLTHSSHLLHIHKKELKAIVRHVLVHPGDYTPLEEYYQQWTGDFLTKNNALLSSLNLSYPALHFEQLLAMLGPSLFTVWKAMVLRKRIMFYNKPPAQHLCHLVHCVNVLASNTQRLRDNLCTPFYFVNIADCDELSRQVAYVACTTEKVFETKRDIYDVYIDHGMVKVSQPRIKAALSVTKGDRMRIQHLISLLRQPVSCDELPMTVEDNFYSYFSALNKAVGEGVHMLAASDDSRLTSHDISSMGLHSSDSAFINELLDSFNLDISVGCLTCDCVPR